MALLRVSVLLISSLRWLTSWVCGPHNRVDEASSRLGDPRVGALVGRERRRRFTPPGRHDRGASNSLAAWRMTEPPASVVLRGRRGESRVLERLVARVRAGESQVLVLRGESGVGKTALLDHLVTVASGCRIARVAGVQSEVELAFAGLHQLCAPFLAHFDRLPAPQRDALATAFGLHVGAPPDRFLVGLATLTMLAEVAEEGPLIIVLDDAQWLDRVSAQTLAFVARRLMAENVGLVLAVREPSDRTEFDGLRDLVISGLGDSDAAALLDSVVTWPVDKRVRERIIAETRGNPLALLELPRGLTPAQLAFGFGLSDGMPLTNRIEQGFIRRLEPLPDDTRRLLLAAAVEPVGDEALLWRAATWLGVGREAAAPAERSRPGGVRRARPLPPSAGALGGVSRGESERAAGGAPRAGRGDRCRRRS